MNDLKICKRCIMDSSVPGIQFDENDICNYCIMYDELEKRYPLNEDSKNKLDNLIEKIKKNGKRKKYDCIIGISGGTDSTYTLYLAKQYGLNPLAIHLDNGWNTKISEENMANAIKKLGIELKRVKVNWNEFKELQIAFLKASTPDAEIPSDHGIKSILYKIAAQKGIKYILTGRSFRTEGKIPPLWSYGDSKYIKSIYKLLTGKKLNHFSAISPLKQFYYDHIKKITRIPFLYYFNYDKKKVKKLLTSKLGWKDYGGHHYESVYTRFCYSYFLPKKFGIDKRMTHFSAEIRSGQMTRDEALKKIKKVPISQIEAEKDIQQILVKLELTEDEFESILNLQPKTFLNYPNYFSIIKRFKFLIKLFYKFRNQSIPLTIKLMDSQRELNKDEK